MSLPVAVAIARRDLRGRFLFPFLSDGARDLSVAEAEAICAAHGVLFIADEVMTGWGRTGTRVACDQAGVIPDNVCLS